MIRAPSTSRSRSIILSGFLILTIMAGLSGCAPISSTETQPIKSTPCPQPPANTNIYTIAPAKWADDIFQHAYTYSLLPTPIQQGEQQIQEARYAAFQYLIKETKRWSTSEIVKLDNLSEALIIITLISPELLQATYLNEIIKHRIFTPDFPTQLQSVLNSVSARNEIIFLVTVITTQNENINGTPHTFDIPVREMILNNSEDLLIMPDHDDHNLDQPIDSSSGYVFGYLAYPFTTLNNNECKRILDPKFNTNIVITVSKILIDGTDNKAKYTWTIPYIPLVNTNAPTDPLMFNIPSNYDTNQISTLTAPPQLNSNGIIPDDYWSEFAKFVWNQLTLGNYY
jgi:hypothetical protein